MAYYNTGFQYQNPYNQMQVQQPQIQSSGVITVRSEAEARNYPIAPGNSIMFKAETGPYVYIKTMGLSQFDAPTFEKFRLVKEEIDTESPKMVDYITKAVFDDLKAEVESLKKSLKEGAEDDE